MDKAFYLDYIRQIIEQTLENEHIKNPNLVGGKNQLNLFSFYEQLVEQGEVDRYVDTFNDLADQQNRMGLIANGIISSPENPTITNLNNVLIVPLSFTCAFRITLENRDLMLETIDNLISIHKGRKIDIAEFDNGKLFMVGTIANNVSGNPHFHVGDFFGIKTNSLQTFSQFMTERLAYYSARGINTWATFGNRTQYIYYEDSDGKLKVAVSDNYGNWTQVDDDGTYDDIIFPPQHNSFKKYKVSISFDALRCETPKSLNGKEIIFVSFSGNATIVSSNVRLGNDLTKVAICKYQRVEQGGVVNLNQIKYWLEPLEMPSSNNADTQLNKLMSNKFVENSHTDSISITLQYTFILDTSSTLLNQWYKYARYGAQETSLGTETITPNIIYRIYEYYSSWGDVEYNYFNAKIIEGIDIENTESDTLTITLPFQIQGANN